MPKPIYRGRIKLWKSDKGWGGIESDETPGDVWLHFSNVEMEGYVDLKPGQLVDFRYEHVGQDSWDYRATWARPVTEEHALGRR